MFEEYHASTRTRIVRDHRGTARMVGHFERYVKTRAADPESAARGYLRRFGHLFGLHPRHLKGLARSPESEPTAARLEYRLFRDKHQFDLSSIVFQQTYWGLPVWEAGVSVVLKHKPLRVVGARSTLHPAAKVKRPSARALADAKTIDAKTLARQLGLPDKAAEFLTINDCRLMVYRHDKPARAHAAAQPKRRSAFRSGRPRLPLPLVDLSIKHDRHYVVNAVYFTFDFPPSRQLNWVALIEVETLSVLLVRPFFDNVQGWVFPADPVTVAGRPMAKAGNAALNRVRSPVTLRELVAPKKGVQPLSGPYVKIADVVTPEVAPPTRPAGRNFKFDARSNDFAAVNAYYNCDRVFRLVEELGFPVARYFPGTKFPNPVDHRGHYDKNHPQGDEINAHCAGNTAGTGISHTIFALADLGNQKKPIGIACDWRIVLHEILGHGVLYNHIGGPRFKFAHSAGDSFAAILNDPGSKAPDRGLTFPWLGIPASAERRHDRTPAKGWGWGGDIAINPFDQTKDPGGYNNEQILSSTMFRFYRAIGGDARDIGTRRFAARMTCHLLLAAIQTLTPATNPSNAAHFASTLMKADLADWPSAGICGGAYHKVIRWAFERQGLYQRPHTKRPNNQIGASPPVDIYVEDGRHGEYHFQPNYWSCQAIWNRRHKDGGSTHETPIAGIVNYAYVKIKNRGWQAASDVTVRAFHCKSSVRELYPDHFTPMQTAQLKAANVPPNSKTEIAVGPFAWVPHAVRDSMLMIASAAGDASNVGNFTARESIPCWRLVPHDNNIAQRNVAVATDRLTRRKRS